METETTLRLAVLGWFGHRNAGDDRIAEVLVRRMAGCHLTFLPFLPLPAEIVNYFDGIVLTGGTWHPRNRLALGFHRWCRQVHRPIVALGLGVEQMTAGLRAGTAALVERAAFLWVRDGESRRLLGDAPRIVVGPDLTWACPYEPDPAPPQGASEAINLRPWSKSEWRPEAWLETLRGLGGCRPWALAPEDTKVLQETTPAARWSFDPSIGRRAAVVVGMRLHSLIFASQMGVPAIAVAYDPKCRRFMETLDKAESTLGLDEPRRLPEVLRQARANRQEESRRLLEQRGVWERRAVELSQEAERRLRQAQERRALDDRPHRRAVRWLGRRVLGAGYARQRLASPDTDG